MTIRNNPMFFVIEGPDGTGKSTLAKTLADRLSQDLGVQVSLCRDPGTTLLGEEIRKLIKSKTRRSPRSELLMFLAARASLVDEFIIPELKQGHWVISDRFELSTLVYQGLAKGVPINEIAAVSEHVTRGVTPSLNIIPMCDMSTQQERLQKRNESVDQFEDDLLFRARVIAGYDMAASVYPKQNIAYIDAAKTPEEMVEQALSVIRQHPIFPQNI